MASLLRLNRFRRNSAPAHLSLNPLRRLCIVFSMRKPTMNPQASRSVWLAWNVFFLNLILVSAFSAELSEPELLIKKFQVAPGFKVELFASEPMLGNPVAFTMDEQGRAYVVETHRFNNSVFDITQNTNWLANDLALRTVAERTAFMSNVFATNLSVMTRNSE